MFVTTADVSVVGGVASGVREGPAGHSPGVWGLAPTRHSLSPVARSALYWEGRVVGLRAFGLAAVVVAGVYCFGGEAQEGGYLFHHCVVDHGAQGVAVSGSCLQWAAVHHD
jgi:hypothetical protein